MGESGGRAVVVGAGVVGCATAWRLSRVGFSVALVDRDPVASHASGTAAGNLNPLYETPADLVPFALESMREQRALQESLPPDLGTGAASMPVSRLHLIADDSERVALAELESRISFAGGFSSRWLDASELRTLEPRVGAGFSGALLTEGSGCVDSQAWTLALSEGARRNGASIVRAEVLRLSGGGGRISAVETSEGELPCDTVVLATGPWVDASAGWLGEDLAVEPVKGELLRLRKPGEPLRHDFTYGRACLYRRCADEVWVGGTSERCGLDAKPTDAARESLLEGALRILPALREAEIVGHTACLRPMTPSGRPLVRRAQAWKNVWLANGAGAKGILLSAGMSRAVCDLILDGETPLSIAPPVAGGR